MEHEHEHFGLAIKRARLDCGLTQKHWRNWPELVVVTLSQLKTMDVSPNSLSSTA